MRRVLIIEESTTLRFLLTRSLEMDNFDVIHADSIADGIEIISSDAFDEFALDGIVLSWPVNLSARQKRLYSLLKEQRDNIPLVILSPRATDEILHWTSERKHSALTLLAQYNDVPATLSQLIDRDSEDSAILDAIGDEHDIHILFVDDSRSIRSYYKRLLHQHHYAVTTATSVEDAWAQLQKNDGNLDIVITDYFMPDENGYTLCQKISATPAYQHILTAVLTGTYLDEAIQDSLNAGAMECMFKEESDDLFLARVHSMARAVRNNKAIEGERKRLDSILSLVGEGVYGVDLEGIITFINPAALNILGYEDEADFIGESAFKLFHYLDENSESVLPRESMLQQSYVQAVPMKGLETVFVHRQQRIIPVDCTIVPFNVGGHHEGSVVAFRDVSERKLMEQQLRWQATHDPLTELFNRYYLEEKLAEEFKELQHSNDTSALLYLDLDRFKYINDTAGHKAGDELLVKISKLLASRSRDCDTLARLGGDEFAVILRNITDDELYRRADNYHSALAGLNFSLANEDYVTQCSIGAVLFDHNSFSPSDIMAQADIACHQAKLEGRNKTHIYNPASDARNTMTVDLGLFGRLHTALDNNRFELHYHPILGLADIDLNDLPHEDGKLWEMHRHHSDHSVYLEALLRMKNDEGKLIMPSEFMSCAERFSLMPRLDLWSIKKAIHTLEELTNRDQLVTIGVNLSAMTLDDEDTMKEITSLIKDMQAPQQYLTLEVTETSAIASMENVKLFIDDIKRLGCRFALDDFGAGFSSFAQLRHLPIDYVKIDGQYVENMARDAIDRAVVMAVNDVAHSIGKHTIAEYVSSPETLRLLKICGVDYVQGHYIALPMTEQELLAGPALDTGRVSHLKPVS